MKMAGLLVKRSAICLMDELHLHGLKASSRSSKGAKCILCTIARQTREFGIHGPTAGRGDKGCRRGGSRLRTRLRTDGGENASAEKGGRGEHDCALQKMTTGDGHDGTLRGSNDVENQSHGITPGRSERSVEINGCRSAGDTHGGRSRREDV